MADKYLYNNAGTLTEKEALVVSAGAGDAGKIPALGGSGRLDNSVMPVGIGADTASIEADENLSSGDFVNVFSDGGDFKVRKADATTAGKHAHGFVLESVTAEDSATVYFEGTNTALTSLAPGDLYLSTTAGQATSTAPSGAGNVVQRLGVAVSATAANVETGVPIVLAS